MRAVIEHVSTGDVFGRGQIEHYRTILPIDEIMPIMEFSKLIGGMSWPYKDYPGFVLVLAADMNKDPVGRDYVMRVLKEYENDDIMRLIQMAAEYKKAYYANPWYTDTTDRHSMLQFVAKLNKGALGGNITNAFNVQDAPYVDDVHNLQFYANMIKVRLKPTYKTLYFGAESKLPAYIGALQPEQITQRKAKEFPAVAALGFALAGMEMWNSADAKNLYNIQDEYIKKHEVDGL